MAKAELGLLDNPIWNALRTDHAAIALGDDRARRYPPEIGPLAGIPEQAADSYEALGTLAGSGIIALFSIEPFHIPSGWKVLREGSIVQMIRERAPQPGPHVSSLVSQSVSLRQLTAANVPAMVALAELTEPGPFRSRTFELGNFYGIFHRDRLVSMAGKRMHLFFFNDTATTEIYTLSYTTLSRAP